MDDDQQPTGQREEEEEVWPDWDDAFAEHDARILFPDLFRAAARSNGQYDSDANDRNDPVIGIPGHGGIRWSEGMETIEGAYPDYKPPSPYDFEKESANWNPEVQSKHAEGSETKEDTIASNKLSPMFPPTPGRYPSLSSTDVSQLESSIHSSADEDGPVAKRQKINTKNKNTNCKGGKTAATGSEKSIDTYSISQDELDEDTPYPPTPGAQSDILPVEDGDATMHDVEPIRASDPDVEMIEAPHPRIQVFVEIPAPPSSLAAAPMDEANSSSVNKTGKSPPGLENRTSIIEHNGTQVATPSTPPRIQKQNQVSAGPPPIATDSPLKELQRSVAMGRKTSFSEAHASSAEDAPKLKLKVKDSDKSGNMALGDADLVDDFVFRDEQAVNKMKAVDLRAHIRTIEALKIYCNGVSKKHMVELFMKWQRGIQALQAEKANAATKNIDPSQAGGLGSEEEGDDIDAEGSTDEEFLEAQESPVTGKVTPGPPLKSPFTDQPRSAKQSPFVAKLTAASESPSIRMAGRPRSPDNEPECYKEFEREEAEKKNKRTRRSASRPASYRV
ncbi:hypothetical protein FKW77_002083 [Venturia effusa]|uniref:Uncharacterized protein n=1 Tax=Venturia effusa TaxID=50376 RepID=A0A517L8R1_9PEZI|nr:hypothetical protein FKW77_002083 [Venturia effusa]